MAQTSAPVKLAKLAASDDILKECDAIEVELEELKANYEQYFLGIERLAPAKVHQRLKSRMDSAKNTFNRTTSVRFRVQSLSSKFLTYERLWIRTMQEIEGGAYKRDLFKARLHARDRSVDRAQSAQVNKAAQADPAASPAKRPGDSPLSPLAIGGDLSQAKLRVIYEAYVEAKKRCREDVTKITFESVASKLRKQVPNLLEKHKVASVEFKVVVKGGKAVLKAVPQRAAQEGDEP
jgi:hypothetical protein